MRDLTRQVRTDLIPFPVAHAGRHWDPTAEFDAVFLDSERRRAFVLEIKWTSEPVGVGTLDDLRRRASLCPALAPLERTCAVVSRAGFRGRAARTDRRYLLDAGDPLVP